MVRLPMGMYCTVFLAPGEDEDDEDVLTVSGRLADHPTDGYEGEAVFGISDRRCGGYSVNDELALAFASDGAGDYSFDRMQKTGKNRLGGFLAEVSCENLSARNPPRVGSVVELTILHSTAEKPEGKMPALINEMGEKLRASTLRLNQATDVLNGIVTDVEAFLDECSVGVPASVLLSIDKEEDGSFSCSTSLVYARINGKYRIGVCEVFADEDYPKEKPWSDCTRAEKVEAAEKLPALLDAITEEVEKRVQQTQKVGATVVEVLKPILSRSKRAPK